MSLSRGSDDGVADVTDPLRPFFLRLRQGGDLAPADQAALREVVGNDVRHIGQHQDIISEGEKPASVKLILKGFACRYKMIGDGQRQIIAYLLPGDLCDLNVALLGHIDHSVGSITACSVVRVSSDALADLMACNHRIARALWRATLVDEAVLRAWLVNVGQRTTDRRMAHLFCELLARLRLAGLIDGTSFEFPFTQQELGQALGVSTVHVNRVLQELRSAGLIQLRTRNLDILDLAGLAELGQFKANYLHAYQDAREGMSEGVAAAAGGTV